MTSTDEALGLALASTSAAARAAVDALNATLQACHERARGRTVDDVAVNFGVSRQLAQQLNDPHAAPIATTLTRQDPQPALRLAFEILSDPLSRAEGVHSVKVATPTTVLACGLGMSTRYIQRWTERATQLGTELNWARGLRSELEDALLLRDIIRGIGGPALAIESANLDGAELVLNAPSASPHDVDAWQSQLPHWVRIRRS